MIAVDDELHYACHRCKPPSHPEMVVRDRAGLHSGAHTTLRLHFDFFCLSLFPFVALLGCIVAAIYAAGAHEQAQRFPVHALECDCPVASCQRVPVASDLVQPCSIFNLSCGSAHTLAVFQLSFPDHYRGRNSGWAFARYPLTWDNVSCEPWAAFAYAIGEPLEPHELNGTRVFVLSPRSVDELLVRPFTSFSPDELASLKTRSEGAGIVPLILSQDRVASKAYNPTSFLVAVAVGMGVWPTLVFVNFVAFRFCFRRRSESAEAAVAEWRARHPALIVAVDAPEDASGANRRRDPAAERSEKLRRRTCRRCGFNVTIGKLRSKHRRCKRARQHAVALERFARLPVGAAAETETEPAVVCKHCNTTNEAGLVFCRNEDGCGRLLPTRLSRAPFAPGMDLTECAICLEEFGVGAPVTFLSCLHFFHCECAVKWLDDNPECPICKAEITKQTVSMK
jgi:hypothetical protein